MRLVHRNGVHGRRHPYLRAHLRHFFREGEIGGAGIDATVNMALRHIDKRRCPLLGGHGDGDAHGLLHGDAIASFELGPVVIPKIEMRRRRRGDGKGNAIGFNGLLIDTDMNGFGKPGEIFRVEAQHRQRLAEHFGGDQRAQRQHVLGLAEDQRRRRTARQDKIEQDT